LVKKAFVERLREERPVIFDGGMGTEIVARGHEPGAATSVTIPDVIREIHRSYREAGADVIIANTFGANTVALGLSGQAGNLSLYISAACRLAREAAGEEGWVAGDIGPTGDFLEPAGYWTAGPMRKVFEESARLLNEGGVDLFIIETMSDAHELTLAVEACRNVAGEKPVIASMTFDPVKSGFRTNMGLSPAKAAQAMHEAGANVIGANCGSVSPEQMAEIVREFRESSDKPILIQANAGLPVLQDGHAVHLLGPEPFAKGMLKAVEAGARLVGGCCGTTPAHIKALTEVILGN
jgi:methionine synthase I (cobalamin-dependent)